MYSRGPMYVRGNYEGEVYLGQDTLVDLGASDDSAQASHARGRGSLNTMKRKLQKMEEDKSQGASTSVRNLSASERLRMAAAASGRRRPRRGSQTRGGLQKPPGEGDEEKHSRECKRRRHKHGRDVPSAMLFATM